MPRLRFWFLCLVCAAFGAAVVLLGSVSAVSPAQPLPTRAIPTTNKAIPHAWRLTICFIACSVSEPTLVLDSPVTPISLNG